VLSLSGVLDAQKTHTMADKIKVMVVGSCGLGICGNWGGVWWLWKEGIGWDADGGWV